MQPNSNLVQASGARVFSPDQTPSENFRMPNGTNNENENEMRMPNGTNNENENEMIQ